MDNVNEVIARNLKNMRNAKGLSQAELAEIVECSPYSIYDWEKGRFAPSAVYLPKMADVFGCTIDALFGR